MVGKIGKNMTRKSGKLGLILLLALSLTTVAGNIAFASNSLNSLDVRKNSSDGLEFTLYTSSAYADSVIVTKKSDNKYVILMPNVSGATNAAPDLSSVDDIVSNVDVRAVNDGGAGYTKVTIITTKPVDIKTSTAKSAPVTAEQNEYRALIAQQKTKPTQKPIAENNVHPAPAFRLPEIQPTTPASTIKTDKPQPQPAVDKKVSQKDLKQAIKQVSDKKTDIIELAQNKIKESTAKKAELQKLEQKKEVAKEIKKEIKDIVPPIPAKETATTKLPETTVVDSAKTATPATKTLQKPKTISTENVITKMKNSLSGRIPKDMPMTLALILIPLICIMILIKLIRASVQSSNILKKSFIDNLSKQEPQAASYDNIINNEHLSWQEKYQKYVDVSGQKSKPAKQEEISTTAKYSFITPKVQTETVPTEDISRAEVKFMDTTSEKTNNNKIEKPAISSLERILHNSPSIEKTTIENDIEIFEDNELFEELEVKQEDTVIAKQLNKSIKLKAFAEKMALEETNRNKKVKHKKVQFDMPKESKHVELGSSQLHSIPRTLTNANLSVSDLIAKSDRLLKKKTQQLAENDYQMVSVDDFFNIMDDNDKSKVTSPLSNRVADSLAQIRPTTDRMSAPQKNITNPISQLRTETKKDYLNGLIVKSGYNIDKERGFYLVNLDGMTALVGRIQEEIFVLKKFDQNVDKPIQVRKDSSNVYMVKADGFKSLVEVSSNKMSVVIEL